MVLSLGEKASFRSQGMALLECISAYGLDHAFDAIAQQSFLNMSRADLSNTACLE